MNVSYVIIVLAQENGGCSSWSAPFNLCEYWFLLFNFFLLFLNGLTSVLLNIWDLRSSCFELLYAYDWCSDSPNLKPYMPGFLVFVVCVYLFIRPISNSCHAFCWCVKYCGILNYHCPSVENCCVWCCVFRSVSEWLLGKAHLFTDWFWREYIRNIGIPVLHFMCLYCVLFDQHQGGVVAPCVSAFILQTR